MEGRKKLSEEELNGLKKEIASYQPKFQIIRNEIARIFIGQDEMVTALLEALLADGHVLVEGIPGVGKTLLIRTLSKIAGCNFSRIQFTPDLLPTDILGITTYEEGKGFYTVKGPVFANFVLGDEINRSPPKVQSALLEAMQEKQVTIGKETFKLPEPFFVMATQNPLEQIGTYKLPEAQLDRFIYKVKMSYPKSSDERKILNTNMTLKKFDDYNIEPILSPDHILESQQLVKKIITDEKVEKYIVRLVEATRDPKKYGVESGKFIAFGASPRASIAIFITSKARALLENEPQVTVDHVRKVVKNVLRHRILINFEGQAEEISSEQIIDEIIQKVKIL
ncbi:MoxR family ATPase [Candidatus Woesearchaeota archaeon]|nr:MoxR family ATPase [Candidatus Woesearchaeota archaeon]MCF7901112.1 MoxR family ATPase [Candidatus Woesearchaeota archaeon]MCF8012899.1 MoxR family ATPase [Candidatus Woesearchaeota archaeon]